MILVFTNFSMLNYPCYILAGWLDQVVVVVVAMPQAHDVGDAGCNRPQNPPVDGSQLVKDGIQWHEWIPVTEP